MRRNGNGHDTSLQGLIDLYLLRCQVEGKSPSTIHAYAETLGRFLRFVCQEGLPEDVRRITPNHLYPYLGQFAHLSLETRHRYFREVRCFFNWLLAAGYIGESPFRSLRNVRLPQKIVRPFSAEDIVRLLACCDPGTAAGARDRAIVLTLLDTGVRCSELVQLTLDDLDLEAGRLRVLHGKGNKDRVVPFASRCREALRHYLGFRGGEAGPLFVAAGRHRTLRPGIALRPNGLKQLLRRLGRQASLSKVHAHRFRHTFATWAIELDARELDVQYLLGHASPDMTRRYASSYTSEQAARRHAAFSPAQRLDEHLVAAHP
jgi:integrase/recombinase XerC